MRYHQCDIRYLIRCIIQNFYQRRRYQIYLDYSFETARKEGKSEGDTHYARSDFILSSDNLKIVWSK